MTDLQPISKNVALGMFSVLLTDDVVLCSKSNGAYSTSLSELVSKLYDVYLVYGLGFCILLSQLFIEQEEYAYLTSAP